MCWMCGCADHIGLGNNRENQQNEYAVDDIIKDVESTIKIKGE